MSLLQSLSQYLVRLRNKLVLSPVGLTASTILFLFATANRTFWAVGSEIFTGHEFALTQFALVVFLLTLSAISLFAFPRVVKPFLALITLLSSVTSYYVDTLGVIVDRDMIQNAMVTTFTESKHLITAGFVIHVVIFGIVPSVVILMVRLKRRGPLGMYATPIASFALCLGLALALFATDMQSYAAVLRERKDLMISYQPGAPLVGMIRYAKKVSGLRNVTAQPIGHDAKKGLSYGNDKKPVPAIVVAGETARSQNFSLNGYGVETNPRLATLPVLSFANVQSCGTATAVSLPCMFSKYERDDYSYRRGLSTENVLDVLSHAGFHVEWWENNTGDKKIAKRIASKSFTDMETPEFRGQGECVDGIFLESLQDYAAKITQDTVLVLHQIGSHGPTYYLRYPQSFEKFTPSCRTAGFMNCTQQEIINAYDTTIAYTDEFLAEVINLLDSQNRADTAMLYVSDHGESLGEGGLYLHGAPYFMAPDTQIKVPMILWMSDAFQDRFSIDRSCLDAQKNAKLNHDNLFHSLLGMLDIATGERNADLDIFASCTPEQRMARR